MKDDTPLYTWLAAAYVRGKLAAILQAEGGLFELPLTTLAEPQLAQLIMLGRHHGLRLHRFKRTMGLARVTRVLGILKGIAPASLLDIGSGRGAFLWPLLDTLRWLPVTALDTRADRIADIQAVGAGGVTMLAAQHGDVTRLPFADQQFDVVTMLEVLEHIPDTQAALAEACRVAQRFMVLSVPSQPDDNPEHIHLFDAKRLEALVRAAGARRVNFDYVPGHLIAVAQIAR